MSLTGPLSINFAYNRNDNTAYFVIESNKQDKIKAVLDLNSADNTLQADSLKNPDDLALPTTFIGLIIPIDVNLAGSGMDLTTARILTNSTNRASILLSETYEKIQIAAKKVFKKEIPLNQNIQEKLSEASNLFKYQIKDKLQQHIADFDSSQPQDDEGDEDSLEGSTTNLTTSITSSTTATTTQQPPVLPKFINYRFDKEQQCVCFLLETENPQQTKETFDKAGFDARTPTKRDQTALSIRDAYFMFKGVVIQLQSKADLKTELEKVQKTAQDTYGSKINLSPSFAATLEPKKIPPPLAPVVIQPPVPVPVQTVAQPFGPPPTNFYAGLTTPLPGLPFPPPMSASTSLTTSTTTTTTTSTSALTTTIPTLTTLMTPSATTTATTPTDKAPASLWDSDDDDDDDYFITRQPISTIPAASSSSSTVATTTAANSASSTNSTRAAQEAQMTVLHELRKELLPFIGLTRTYPIESDEDQRLILFGKLNKHYSAKAYELICMLTSKPVPASERADTGMEMFFSNPQILLCRVYYNGKMDTILDHLIAMPEPMPQSGTSSTSQPHSASRPTAQTTRATTAVPPKAKKTKKTSSYSKKEYEKLTLLRDTLAQNSAKKTSSKNSQDNENEILTDIFGELSPAAMKRICELICLRDSRPYNEDYALTAFGDDPQILNSRVSVKSRIDTIINHLLREFGPKRNQN